MKLTIINGTAKKGINNTEVLLKNLMKVLNNTMEMNLKFID